ncbi:MAG: undecaprenyl-phosphate glucose phosphotransferase [Rhodospirillales bacterium]|nr:undecaprenyl-phosphate glucose phosphotransferase [Rhodospirillales bacterium]
MMFARNGLGEPPVEVESTDLHSRPVDWPNPGKLLHGLAIVIDINIIVVSGFAAYFARHGISALPLDYFLLIVVAALTHVQSQRLVGSYSVEALRRPMARAGRALGLWSLIVLGLIATVYFARAAADVSRVWFGTWFVYGAVAIVMAQGVVSRLISMLALRGLLKTRIAILGQGRVLGKLADRLRASNISICELVGTFSVRRNTKSLEVEWMRATEDLINLARQTRIDEVIIAARRSRPDVSAVVDRLSAIPVNIHFCSHLDVFTGSPSHLAAVTGLPLLGVRSRPLDGWDWVGKRTIDLILAGVAIVLLAPVMLLIALLIRVGSPGPALFRQHRYGFNNREIVVVKFRTMYVGAAVELEVRQATTGDPRVTGIGRLLRRTSLDELPQLINVMTGEMSLVGPRPHAITHNKIYATLIDNYGARCRVKPGITGWAQVNGFRGETESLDKMRRRIEHDIFYIDNWSLLLDLKILLLTLIRGFVHPNAY